MLPEMMGSNHFPVGATLNLSSIPVKQCPPLCTWFLLEFAGTQLKILCFLVPLEQSLCWSSQCCSSTIHHRYRNSKTKSVFIQPGISQVRLASEETKQTR